MRRYPDLHRDPRPAERVPHWGRPDEHPHLDVDRDYAGVPLERLPIREVLTVEYPERGAAERAAAGLARHGWTINAPPWHVSTHDGKTDVFTPGPWSVTASRAGLRMRK